MKYGLLGQDLQNVADCAKKWFAAEYGAKKFVCEAKYKDWFPLQPTWRASLSTSYVLCINVQPMPYSQTIAACVNSCAQRGAPVKLWVAVPDTSAKGFNANLKLAREAGVGVIQFTDEGTPHVCHRDVPLSLYALRKTDLSTVPAVRREGVKTAESTFLDGSPPQGCQAICQELENVTRSFAEHTYGAGLWKSPMGAKSHNARFFTTNSWGKMLEELDSRVDVAKVRRKAPSFQRSHVASTRGYTGWRNVVSHTPGTTAQLTTRDAKLRTMFEATRDLLVDWYNIAQPFKLIK